MKPIEMKSKLRFYTILVIFLMGFLSVRLAFVQLFRNEAYQTRAKDNSIRLVTIKASRGEIYSGDNELLATNKLVYTVSLNYLEISKADTDTIAANLSANLIGLYPEMTPEFIKAKLDEQKFRLFEPIVLLRDIPWDLVVKLEENRMDLPGVTINVEPLRTYPQGSLAGHVLGYIHSISEEEMAKEEIKSQYSLNSLIGKSGVEKQYESYLRGADGAQQIEVDANGRPVPNRDITTKYPVAGSNVYLTINSRLQKVMEQSMEATLKQLQTAHPKARVGAAVLINVKTGEILAMYSSPALNPDDFKGNLSRDKAPYYLPQGDYNPMEPGALKNRAIQGSYPPGSTFKPITGMAALEKSAMNPLNEYVNCAGAYWVEPFIKCTGVHGNVNYYSAMAHSCNTYFQEMGRRAGKDEIIRVANEFGLGTKTGIDLPDETKGLLPTPQWKFETNDIGFKQQHETNLNSIDAKYDALLAQAQSEQEKQELLKKKQKELNQMETQFKIDYNWSTEWKPYDTFNMSIGQGYNDFTVIQLAQYVSTLANGGSLYKPYVVSKVINAQGKVVLESKPTLVRSVAVSARSIAETKRAMLEVGRGEGTGAALFTNFPANIQVAAKTGSAESGRAGDDALKDTHGVFIAFAPFNDPEIAFASVIEYGFSGAISGGPVCKAVFEQYFGIVDHLAAATNAATPPASTATPPAGNTTPPAGSNPPAGETTPPSTTTPPVATKPNQTTPPITEVKP
ncbi:MAG: penicillin-binding protein 2 [Syntrophomonas sp.]